MKTRVITVGPDRPIKHVARLMANGKIGCVFILYNRFPPRLVTTTDDILRYVGRLG